MAYVSLQIGVVLYCYSSKANSTGEAEGVNIPTILAFITNFLGIGHSFAMHV